MFGVVPQNHMGDPGILAQFVGDHPAAVVVLLVKDRIRAADHQAQPAVGGDPAGEEGEAVEFIPDGLSGRDQTLLPQGLAIARPDEILAETDAGPIRPDFINGSHEIRVGYIQGQPGNQPQKPADLGIGLERRAVIHQAVPEQVQGVALVGEIVLELLPLEFGRTHVQWIVSIPVRLGNARRLGIQPPRLENIIGRAMFRIEVEPPGLSRDGFQAAGILPLLRAGHIICHPLFKKIRFGSGLHGPAVPGQVQFVQVEQAGLAEFESADRPG